MASAAGRTLSTTAWIIGANSTGFTSRRSLPVIMPVNYLMYGETVVFRTDPDSKLGRAMRSTTAAFEIDGIDERERTGWSVVVSGRAEEVVEPNELDELRQTPLLPWAAGDRFQYVRIRPRLVTGRCISVAELPSNWWG